MARQHVKQERLWNCNTSNSLVKIGSASVGQMEGKKDRQKERSDVTEVKMQRESNKMRGKAKEWEVRIKGKVWK